MNVVATVRRTSSIETAGGRHVGLLRDYATLFKMRILLMVMATWVVGVDLGSLHSAPFRLHGTFVMALLGLCAVTAGSGALNQVLERRTDRLMIRTELRPLAQNRLCLAHGIILGLISIMAGVLLLLYNTNILSSLLALAASVGYVGVYTPLKLVTQFNVIVGAIFGALPPLIGWTAATGRLDWPGVALFVLLFVWQLSHVAAIGWLNRDDYICAGIRVPASFCDRQAAARCSAVWAVLFAIVMIPISLCPIRLHSAGSICLVAATGLGIWYLSRALKFAGITKVDEPDNGIARAQDLLRASIIYLPILLLILLLGAHFI